MITAINNIRIIAITQLVMMMMINVICKKLRRRIGRVEE